MFRKLLIVSILIFQALVFRHVAAIAQEAALTPEQRQAAQVKLMPSMIKLSYRFLGDGRTLGMTYLNDGDLPGFQAIVGSTDEQYYAFDKYMVESKAAIRSQLDAIMSDALHANSSEEMADAETRLIATLDGVYDAMDEKLRDILNPGQIMKIQELELQTASHLMPAGLPMIKFGAYEALGLDEKQKQELDRIRLEFCPEQERFFEEMMKMLPKPGQQPKPEEMKKLTEKMSEHEKKGEILANRIRAKILSIFNKDQEKKLNDLLANIPDFVKEKKNKRGQPPQQVDEKAYDTWKESWKPGDPIPAEFREREKSKRRVFPTIN